MAEVSRDLPDLLDYTGRARVVGGERDGEEWVLNRAVPEWSRPDGTGRWLPHSMPRITADYDGGRVSAVLPEEAPEPPVGSVVRLVSADSQGAPQTRTGDGWCWIDGHQQYGEAKTWAQMQAFAAQVGMPTELVALPATVPAVEARQLTEDGDWEAIAAWCGGRVVGQTSDAVLMLNTCDEPHAEASAGDWIVRDGHEWRVVPTRFVAAIAAAREAER